MKRHILWGFLAAILFAGNIYAQQSKESSAAKTAKKFRPKGKWRGVFTLSNGTEIPFNFEIKDTAGQARLYFLNAEERF